MTYFRDKSAAITGAGSGIGRALALQLNAAGCRLYLSDIDETGLQATASLLPRPEVPAHCARVDVADRNQVQAWADDIAAAGTGLNLLVNNAGVALAATVAEGTVEDVEWLMGINFWGVVYGTTSFMPLLQASGAGHLVNISSVFGLVGIPTQSAYNAAKFAVRGYTEALRQELAGTPLHVMCVHPGGIKTNIARNSRGGAADMGPDDRHQRFQQAARTSAESAASQILQATERRRKRLLIGLDARYLSLISRLFPVHYPRFIPGLKELVR